MAALNLFVDELLSNNDLWKWFLYLLSVDCDSRPICTGGVEIQSLIDSMVA